MKKRRVIILALVFSAAGFNAATQTLDKDNDNQPSLLEESYGSYGGGGFIPVPVPPGPAGPVPNPPVQAGVFPPGPLSSGIPPAVYSADISPERIRQVLSTAKGVRQHITTGKIWMSTGPGGELEICGGILYRGAVVSVVQFSPLDGSVLPAEYRSAVYREEVSVDKIKDQFSKVVEGIRIVEGAWFRQPEACWIVPVAYRGEIIAFFRIYSDGQHVLPDYNASREMEYYGL